MCLEVAPTHTLDAVCLVFICEKRKASQRYASSECCRSVGRVLETIDQMPTAFLDLEKIPTWDKDWRGKRLKV